MTSRSCSSRTTLTTGTSPSGRGRKTTFSTRVAVASNGAEALTMLLEDEQGNQGSPALILLDLEPVAHLHRSAGERMAMSREPAPAPDHAVDGAWPLHNCEHSLVSSVSHSRRRAWPVNLLRRD
jgi:hypothetical protein